MQRLHLISGILLLLIFALSGQYLKAILPALEGPIDGQRMMYRASHVYILMIGLLHLVLGIYYQAFEQGLQRLLQQAGSLLLCLAAVLLLWAFATEPAVHSTERSLTVIGCVLALAGSSFMLAAAVVRYWRARQS
jgi:hypothetical protein